MVHSSERMLFGGIGSATVNSMKKTSAVSQTNIDLTFGFLSSHSEVGSKFPAEKGRYHLFLAYACPWAHRTLITRAVKGLEDVISITVVMPVWQRTKPDDPEDSHCGWVFSDPDGEHYPNAIGLGGPFPASYPENDPEPFYGSSTIRELYERLGDFTGTRSVPILWDKKQNTIVNNE